MTIMKDDLQWQVTKHQSFQIHDTLHPICGITLQEVHEKGPCQVDDIR